MTLTIKPRPCDTFFLLTYSKSLPFPIAVTMQTRYPFSIEFVSNIGKLAGIAEFAHHGGPRTCRHPVSQMNRELGAWQMIFKPRGAYNEGMTPDLLDGVYAD